MTRIANIFRILGVLVMLYSITLIPPILVEEWYRDGSVTPFVYSILFLLFIGLLIWIPFRKYKAELLSRDGFIIVVAFWMVFAIVGAFPFYLTANPMLSFTDAFFESVSGVTTTGASILIDLDKLPHSLLYYRQQLQFLGGMSIIILAVAILPMLGVGGMQLYRAETTGPVKDNKLTPRIAQTAKAILFIYLIFTLLCATCYWLLGMNLFDAIGYTFSTVSTGGFATHDLSMKYFYNPLLKFVAILFMFLSAVSFNLHFMVIHTQRVGIYRSDPELKTFVWILLTVFICVWLGFFLFNIPDNNTIVLDSIFTVVSICTTTGLTTSDFSLWPAFIPLMLLFGGIIGGCAGSTTGGLKVIRFLLLMKQGNREINRLIHPHAHYTIKLGEAAVSNKVVEGIWGFLAMYFGIFCFFLLLLLLTETDFLTAYSALIATISNIGVGLGTVSNNFSQMSDLSKWILSFAMIVGRLEIFTVLILFSPEYWRN